MTNPTIYSGSERILRAGVFCTLLDLTLTFQEYRDKKKSLYEEIHRARQGAKDSRKYLTAILNDIVRTPPGEITSTGQIEQRFR